MKPYHYRTALDNSWVFEQAANWEPTEVATPDVDLPTADGDLGLSSLFPSIPPEEPDGLKHSESSVNSLSCPVPLGFPRLGLPPQEDTPFKESGGEAGHQRQEVLNPAAGVDRPKRNRRCPDHYGEWTEH